MDTDFIGTEPQPWEFRAKPVWQRIVVITAGVIFNIILACVIFIGLKYAYGDARPLSTEDGSVYVADRSLAYRIGLRTGDRILRIGDEPFDPYRGLRNLEALMVDAPALDVVRRGDTLRFKGPEDIMTQLARAGGLGLSAEASVVGDVQPGSPAQQAGLEEGDRITAVNGEPVQFWPQMTEQIQASKGRPLDLTWQREGRTLEAHLTPEEDQGRYYVGIRQAMHYQEYGLGQAVVAGVVDTWFNTKTIAINLKRIVTGRENIRENLGGPVMVAKITGQAAQAGPFYFWSIVALLSITLAIVNILPIPALDGGHLVFLIYEGVTRREPSVRVRMVMQQVGMVLLLTLMAFLVFNDILRL